MSTMKSAVICLTITLFATACNSNSYDATKENAAEQREQTVASNIKKYSNIWDEFANHRKIEVFNDSNFTKDVIIHAQPNNVVGIDSARAYYENYLTGFSNIKFTIVDIFGEGNKLMKHWHFTGKHTGDFFGIAATGKDVEVDAVTVVRMQDGKIAEETDFVDNLEFMQQLGVIPR